MTSPGATDLLLALQAAVGDRYEIKQQLGRGGMGAVYLAVDRRLDREVAIKVLPPDLAAHDDQFVGRFEQEARTSAKLDHSGIIPIYAVESHGALHYFVMKYVNGRSLESLLATGPMPVDLAQRLLWEAACALGHAHQRGVVHRDVKPANMMIDEAGRLLLTDFGISKALRSASSLTATGQVIGTPHYMSPEQAKGDAVGVASDQYSLGVVGYRMFADRLPFEEDSVHTVIYKHVFEDPPDLASLKPDLPPFLGTAIHRAMRKDPAQRFPTMEGFATAVWPENPVEARPGSGSQAGVRRSVPSTEAPTEVSRPEAGPAVRAGKRSRVWAMLAVVLVLAGAGAAAWLTPAGRNLLTRVGVLAAAPPPVSTAPPITALPPADTGGATAAPDSTPNSAPASPPANTRPQRATTPPPVAAPKLGTIAIRSTPDGKVFIDEIEKGDSPGQWDLREGRHVISVRREGWRTWADTVTIVAGNTLFRTPVLTRVDQ